MEKQVSKRALARSLGISRSNFYYILRRPLKDEKLKRDLLSVWQEHPAYGHRRIAIHLKVNRKRILRVMRKFKLYPVLVRKKRKYTHKQAFSVIPNRSQEYKAVSPNTIWAGDFTYLWYHGRYIYLATVLDTFTREVIGWQIGLHHTTRLVVDVLVEARRKRNTTPRIFHSDQGSEYASSVCIEWLVKNDILPSHSPKGKPWINGKQESFFSSFKLEFGKASRFKTIDKLIEGIGQHIFYYNTKRIHSALKMPPYDFLLEWRKAHTIIENPEPKVV
ncbi:MAG: IS3 family transposase [Candidatus Manganitrophaceae bacterium]